MVLRGVDSTSTQQHSAPRRFDVIVEFLNNETVYGVERYVIDAADADEAQRIALQPSEDSLYDDGRILIVSEEL